MVYPRVYNLKVYSLRCPHICRNIKDFIVLSGKVWKKKPTDIRQKHQCASVNPETAAAMWEVFFLRMLKTKTWPANVIGYINYAVPLILSGKLAPTMVVTSDIITIYHHNLNRNVLAYKKNAQWKITTDTGANKVI